MLHKLQDYEHTVDTPIVRYVMRPTEAPGWQLRPDTKLSIPEALMMCADVPNVAKERLIN